MAFFEMENAWGQGWQAENLAVVSLSLGYLQHPPGKIQVWFCRERSGK